MGMSDLGEIATVAGLIRELLGLPRPNALRALARIPPFQAYLRKRQWTGKTYDTLTFIKFCKENGFNYALLR
jgi:hypothetical protein